MSSTAGARFGHVEQVDKFAIRGWALNPEDLEERVRVEIIQAGRSVVSVAAFKPARHVLEALKITAPTNFTPKLAWQLLFPLANGIAADQPFDVYFAGTDTVLGNGQSRRIASVEGLHPSVTEDFRNEQFIMPRYERQGSSIVLQVRTFEVDGRVPRLNITPSAAFAAEEPREVDPQECRFLGRRCFLSRFTLPSDPHGREIVVGIAPRQDHVSDLVRSVHLPPEAFAEPSLAAPPIPSVVNIRRVGGPIASQLTYVVGGWTTYQHLNSLSQTYFGQPISAWQRVLDWGAGCGRLLRHFLNDNQEVVGVDIDPINVEWCREHLGSRAKFHLLGVGKATLPADDASVDLLYGISVMTHLAEHEQHRWLREIRRAVRPGGMVVLTSISEFALLREPSNIALPMVEKFGFFDGVSDPALGAEFSSYYRGAYHSRRYITEQWGEYFEIAAVVSGGNAFEQDYVVLRA